MHVVEDPSRGTIDFALNFKKRKWGLFPEGMGMERRENVNKVTNSKGGSVRRRERP